jgi:nardilysin
VEWEEDGSEPKKRKEKGGDKPLVKKAAAAMCVGIGSFADPPKAQGLAHFLEHMLFMGSSEFPDENEYDSYLSKHGGASNAFTETEYTCYHFEVKREYLKGALDRFSQFFVSPLVKTEAMDREILAVDSGGL